MNYRIQIAGLAVLAAFFSAVPAAAQTRTTTPTLVQDRDQKGRNAFRNGNLYCAYMVRVCAMEFPAVPAGKRLVIEHVSGVAVVGAATSLQRVTLWAKPVMPMAYVHFQTGVPNGNGIWESTFGGPVFAVFLPGEIPAVEVIVNDQTPFTAQVAITGYWVDIP